MRKVILLFILISINICPAQNNRNALTDQDLDKVVKLTYELNFDEAYNLIENHLSMDQSSIIWKYMHAMVTFRKSLYLQIEGEIKNFGEQKSHRRPDLDFFEFKEITHLGDVILNKDPNDTVALFYTGASYGYIGLSYALNGDKFKAASEGKKGLDYHDRLISLCPDWADAYFGQAIFNYYASDVPWYLKPVLWILKRSGSEENAVKYLSLVIQKGRLARYEALEMLSKLYIRQGETSLARKDIDELVNLIPSAKYFYLYQFANEFRRYEMDDEANKLLIHGIDLSKNDNLNEVNKKTLGNIYLQLAMNYRKSSDFKNTVNILKEFINRNLIPEEETMCYYVIGDCYISLGDHFKAEENFNWVLKNGTDEDFKRKATNKMQIISKQKG
ncbi:MAG: hypothetical protein NTX65_15580 [Ignavibacteriales bacterium]|nr:hypothetical protein [Ignavibacteriales bacterium]